MIWLILGLALWCAVHFFKRVAPDLRASIGDVGKGIVAAGVVVSIILMVIGYGAVDVIPLWKFGGWALSLNNLLMVAAIALFFVRDTKSRLKGKLRHPMLIGFLVWVVAHLLVNGDLGSLVLFGGLGLWAVASILLINRAEPAPVAVTGGTIQGDVRLAVQTIIVYAIIAGIHTWLGRWPFPG